MEKSFVFRTLTTPEELRESQLLRAEVYCNENGWIHPARLKPDGREEDQFDRFSTHGGAFYEGQLIGTFRMIPDSELKLPVKRCHPIPRVQRAVELSRLAVSVEYRNSVVMIGLCRWIYGEAVRVGATHMYALMEMGLIQSLLRDGFPFAILGHDFHRVYRNSQDWVTVCPVAEIVPSLVEADRWRKRQLAPLFAKPFDGNLNMSMLYPDTQTDLEMEVA